jgi:C-5 cytosine-specific DNA methylase
VKPLAIDLYCGLGGWAEGFLAEGFNVIGFDIERHDYGTGGYPGQLVIQDVLSLDGRQFKDAAVIVASPPCQAYSYRAMPWKRAKALPPPDNTLFEACFRIQREASEAAGRHIPMIVENVRGAEKWVGSAQWHFGSFYLWGDIPALMPNPLRLEQKINPDGTKHPSGSWFKIADSKNRGVRQNLDGRKLPGNNATRMWSERRIQRLCDATKQGGDWFGSGKDCSAQRRESSSSVNRKAASAMIAKIPFPLACHIARCFNQS